MMVVRVVVFVLVAAVPIGFLGSIAWVILMVDLSRRGRRRALAASLRPRFVVPWKGRLDGLRDALVDAAPNRAPWALERSGGLGANVFVSVMGKKRREGVCVAVLRRNGKSGAIVEVRSAHPVLRPSRARAAHAVALVADAVALAVPAGSFDRS